MRKRKWKLFKQAILRWPFSILIFFSSILL
jgi:hypothetical protein